MNYGKVISGGKQMSKGLTKNINDKRDSREDEVERRLVIATAVNNAFKQKNLSDPTTGRGQNNGSFLRAKANRNV